MHAENRHRCRTRTQGFRLSPPFDEPCAAPTRRRLGKSSAMAVYLEVGSRDLGPHHLLRYRHDEFQRRRAVRAQGWRALSLDLAERSMLCDDSWELAARYQTFANFRSGSSPATCDRHCRGAESVGITQNILESAACDCTCECWGCVGTPQDTRPLRYRRPFPT